MIVALAISGASLLAIFALSMLIILIGTAVADTGYVGKHRAAAIDRRSVVAPPLDAHGHQPRAANRVRDRARR